MPAAEDQKLPRSVLLGLGAMVLAVLVIANDFTALSVALSQIERDFSTDVTMTQWVINGYALVFGVLIVAGGRLADIFGRRRVFFVGSGIFALFSVLGGFAPDIYILIACRALMGIGGAMMWPAVLGMTYAIIPAGKEGLAGGVILGSAGFGNAVGPLIGGVLTDVLSWRWIFFLNLPVAATAAIVTWRTIPGDSSDASDKRIDYGGIAVLSVALFALLVALDEGTDLGWSDPLILGLFAACVIGLIGFWFVERGAGSHALVPSDVMKNRTFAAAFLATLLMSVIFFAALIYLPQFMTKVLHFTPIQSGAGLLPMMGTFAIASFVAGRLYEHVSAKLIVSVGALCLTLGMFWLSRLAADTHFIGLVPGMVILGAGVGLFYSSITTTAITALAKARASLGGGIIYMAQIAGGSVGLGLNTAIVVSAPNLSQGIRTAFLVDSILAAGGLMVVILFIGGKADREHSRSRRFHHHA